MAVYQSTYAKLASYALIISSALQIVMHFWVIKPSGPEEMYLLELMRSFHKNFAGGSMSPKDIQDGLNLCYALFFLYIGIINLLITRSKETSSQQKVSLLTSFTLSIGTAVSIIYFFWLPVVLFSITAICFFINFLKLRTRQ
jgi:hypothetical protein